ncbi:MAG: hypothetical protein J2P15_15700 [Micromonosporaceae bacterium]|nr:hypothetical protein [Micromonosporaceae bacterium]
MNEEYRLATALAELAEAEIPGAAPVEALVRRGRRTRQARTVSVAGAATATLVAGALVTASVSGALGASSAGHRPGVPAQPSFHYRLTAWGPGRVIHSSVIDGVYDPVNQRASITVTNEPGTGFPGPWEEHLAAGRCFTKDLDSAGPWKQWTLSECGLPPTVVPGVELSASSGTLLARLNAAGSTRYQGRTGTGAAAIDTWTFQVNVPNVWNQPVPVTGTVTATASTGLVTEITTLEHRTATVPSVPKGDTLRDSGWDWKLSDYGTPVVATVPSDEPPASPAPSATVPPTVSPIASPTVSPTIRPTVSPAVPLESATPR